MVLPPCTLDRHVNCLEVCVVRFHQWSSLEQRKGIILKFTSSESGDNGKLLGHNERGALSVQAGQRAFVADRTTAPYLVGTAIPYRIAP
jgi:hypothetical protein